MLKNGKHVYKPLVKSGNFLLRRKKFADLPCKKFFRKKEFFLLLKPLKCEKTRMKNDKVLYCKLLQAV